MYREMGIGIGRFYREVKIVNGIEWLEMEGFVVHGCR